MTRRIKVLIADTDADFCRLLSDSLEAEGLETAGRAADGVSALLLCEALRPDAVLVDLVLPRLDGLAVIERLAGTGTAVFVVSALYNDELVARCAELGVRFFARKPCPAPQLAMRIRHSVQPRPLPEPRVAGLESEISDVLRELGVPAHVKGYHYLRRAIALAVDDAGMLGAVTKELYPAVAESFSATPQRVERAIRCAIESAWSRCGAEARHSGFGAVSSRTGRPSNSEFIAVVADQLSILRRARAAGYRGAMPGCR